MGYRKLPFGYRMVMGEIAQDPAEAELVRHIFNQYLSGASFKALTDEMQRQPIPFAGERAWNKNIIARLLADRRYIGEGGFPPIISTDTLSGVVSRRNGQQRPSRQTAESKALRHLGCKQATEKQQRQILDLLNGLIRNPRQIEEPYTNGSFKAVELRRRLDEVMRQLPVDEDRANVLLREYALASYEAIDPNEYDAHRLRLILSEAQPMCQINTELLLSTVSAILTDGAGEVRLQLKNQQIIEGLKAGEEP